MVNIDEEIVLLKGEIKRLGEQRDDGKYFVKFGKIVRDQHASNIFEALVGTLKAAKKRKVVAYDSELLLQGPHDNVDIVLLEE
ncbi:costars family protein [Clavulina sp. PMI_390]|nr:costars family protein [Clavulina sp. PMI_390]